jgi:hypothetical protein
MQVQTIKKGAYSISEFCAAHRISRATYYNLRKSGKAPVEMEVGARRLISDEAAATWRRLMEAKTAEAAA